MGFNLLNSYDLSLGDPSLATGSSGSDFGLANSYNPSLGLPWLGQAPASGEPPLWQQILAGLGGLNSLLDPYIYTEQERMAMEVRKAMAEAEKVRAEAEARRASIEAAREGAVPPWVWVALAGLGVVAVIFLLKD